MVTNLAEVIKARLPDKLVALLQEAGTLAQNRGENLYLVGGVVRDLLLERPVVDLDLVLEGDAIVMAQELASCRDTRITIHSRFGTAKFHLDKWSIDVATARAETYTHPGALPTVRPGSIENDLFRRDFTINAIAVQLNSRCYGDILDIYEGRADLEGKLIRVLHDKSFINDATRIWRGIRYEQRLDFHLEQATLSLIKHDLDILATISGDRIRHELDLVLYEDFPEKAMHRADELGVLARLHPSLKGDDWLAEKFFQARCLCTPDSPSVGLYLSLLAYRLSVEACEELITYLRPPKTLTQKLRHTLSIKEGTEALAAPGIKPSCIYHILCGYDSTALTANLLGSEAPVMKGRIQIYLEKLRYMKAALDGKDLKRMGIAEGPRIKEVLEMLRSARLDGKIKSKQEEEEMVRGWDS